MADRRFKDILGIHTGEYDPVNFYIHRDSSVSFDDIQNTMGHLYVDAKSRHSEASVRIAGSGAVVST